MNRLYLLPPGISKEILQIVHRASMDPLNRPDLKWTQEIEGDRAQRGDELRKLLPDSQS